MNFYETPLIRKSRIQSIDTNVLFSDITECDVFIILRILIFWLIGFNRSYTSMTLRVRNNDFYVLHVGETFVTFPQPSNNFTICIWIVQIRLECINDFSLFSNVGVFLDAYNCRRNK